MAYASAGEDERDSAMMGYKSRQLPHRQKEIDASVSQAPCTLRAAQKATPEADMNLSDLQAVNARSIR